MAGGDALASGGGGTPKQHDGSTIRAESESIGAAPSTAKSDNTVCASIESRRHVEPDCLEVLIVDVGIRLVGDVDSHHEGRREEWESLDAEIQPSRRCDVSKVQLADL